MWWEVSALAGLTVARPEGWGGAGCYMVRGNSSGLFSATAAHSIGLCLEVYLTALKRNDTGGCRVCF